MNYLTYVSYVFKPKAKKLTSTEVTPLPSPSLESDIIEADDNHSSYQLTATSIKNITFWKQGSYREYYVPIAFTSDSHGELLNVQINNATSELVSKIMKKWPNLYYGKYGKMTMILRRKMRPHSVYIRIHHMKISRRRYIY